MILKSLTIENIRLFRGVHTLDLSPEKYEQNPKHIILIGGKNGAGKTTLFESILLCLYGQQIPEIRMSKQKYIQFIEQMISKNKDELVSKKAGIEINFEFSHAGTRHIYMVKRSWSFNPQFSEQLIIHRDGTPLKDIESDQWQDLLNELIPSRFSRLFLFDGEKIQNLVEDNTDNIYLRDSFKSLLGLDHTERLKSDLGIFLNRELKSKNSLDAGRINELEEEIKEFQDKKEVLLQERAQIQGKLDHVLGDIDRQELELASEGGSFARKRDDLKSEKTRLDGEIHRTESDIRDLCAGLLPFAITPKYCQILKQQLIREDELEAKVRSKEIIRKNVKGVRKSLDSGELLNEISLSDMQKKHILQKFSDLLTTHFDIQDSTSNQAHIHHLSQHDHHKLLQWISDATVKVPDQMTTLSKQLEDLTQKRVNVEGLISKAPSDDVIEPIIRKLNELHQVMGQYIEQLRKLDSEINKFDLEIAELDRQKRKKEEELQGIETGEVRIQLAQKVRTILDQYMQELQKQKISQLSDAILACFTRLLRKEDYIEKIVIDEKYAITLYEPDGHAIPKEKLSAGEKEIFAISLLWGLTLTSGRQLPFIIDTPLGRLDSDHRGNLVMDFFQNAGDQMIIFSTDTEIDKEYYRVLEPFIARAYHLNYKKKERASEITPGYFWQKVPVEAKL